MSSDDEPKAEGETKSDRKSHVEPVTSPLSFFALIVAVCEGIIGVACTHSKLTADQQFFILKGLLYLLGAQFGVVVILTWLKPRHLSVDMAKALEKSEQAERDARIARAAAEQTHDLLTSTGVEGMLEEFVDRRIERRTQERQEEER